MSQEKNEIDFDEIYELSRRRKVLKDILEKLKDLNFFYKAEIQGGLFDTNEHRKTVYFEYEDDSRIVALAVKAELVSRLEVIENKLKSIINHNQEVEKIEE